MDLNALREKRVKANDKMQAILSTMKEENRDVLTKDEKISYDASKTEYVELGETIARVEDSLAIGAELEQARPRRVPMGTPGAIAPYAKKEFDSFDDFMTAVVNTRHGKDDSRLEYQAGQSTSDGPSGGFAIPATHKTEVLEAVAQESVLEPLFQMIEGGEAPDAEVTIPALAQSTNENIYGGVALTWVDTELDADLPTTDADIRQISLKPNAVAGTIEVTNKLLRNWPSAGSFYNRLLLKALAHAHEKAFRNGTGAKQPLGIQNSNNLALLKVNRATANRVKYADLVNMLKIAHGANLTFVFSQRMIADLYQLEDSEGHLIFGTPVSGLPSTVLGHKYVVDSRGPAIGSLGDALLIDGGHYLVKKGSGPYVDISAHQKFARDRSMIRIIDNIDGQPWLKDPIESENESTTVSPYVALDVPA